MGPAAILEIFVNAQTGVASTKLTKLNSQMKATEMQAHKSSNALGGKLAKGAKVAGAATAALAAYGLYKAVNAGAEFEKQMDSLGAVSEATGRQMKRLEKQALELGESTQFTANEVAKAQTELVKGGLSLKQVMGGGLKATLSLAAAGELELAAAAETTVNAMKLFGLRGKDAEKVADGLATAANKTTADVSDFAVAFKQGGSAVKQAGRGFNDALTILEALAENGIKNSDAGTSMKTAILQLLAPTDKQAKLAKLLNLQFVDQKGNLKDAAALADDLRDSLGGYSNAQRTAYLKTLAGTDGFRALAALYDAGPEKLRALEQANLRNGTAQDVARQKMDNLTGDAEQLTGALETQGIKLTKVLTPGLRSAVQWLTKFVQSTGSMDLNALAQKLGIGRKELKQFGQAAQNVIDFWKKYFVPVLKDQLAGVIQALQGFVQIVRGIVRVIAGVLTGDFGLAWRGVKDIFSGSVKFILGNLKASTAPFRAAAEVVGGALGKGFSVAWGGIEKIFTFGANKVIDVINSIIDVINIIPGVPDIGKVEHLGEDGDGKKWRAKGTKKLHGQHRYSGGPITKPMAIVGEEAPRHNEWVIATNPAYKKANLAYWAQAGADLGVPGFAVGGLIGSKIGEAIGGGGSAGKDASYFLGKLPTPSLPQPFAELGPYLIAQVSDYIKSGFKDKKFGELVGGLTDKVITGRVSYFNGPASTTASGTPVSKPGLALNLHPGTHAGWDNSITRGWMSKAASGHPVFARTTITGHSANLPIIDLGPHESTGRAIDVTEAGVRKLGLDPASFPTDAIGKAVILRAMGGLIGFAKGGKLGRPGSPSGPSLEERFLARIGGIWPTAAPFYWKSPESPAPPMYLATGLMGQHGQVGKVERYKDGRRMVFFDRGWANQLLRGGDYAKSSLLHEWAHYFQTPGLAKWQAEGGATAFQRWAAPQVFSGFSDTRWPMGYRKYAEAVESKLGQDWIERGQFGLGGLSYERDGNPFSEKAMRGGAVAGPLMRSSGGFLPRTIERVKAKADLIARNFTGYVWGGGHGEGDHVTANGLDCSGAVAKLMQMSGWSFPVGHSSAYESRFHPGIGDLLTIWSNSGHTFAEIEGKMWGTNSSNGLGYHSHTTSGFVPRHPTLGEGSGSTGQGRTEAQQTAAEGKARKTAREAQLKKLRQAVADAKTDPAKQSKLWQLAKFWGRVGMFDKDERAKVLDFVQQAASKTKVGDSVGVLQNLAAYAGEHGEITGKDPDNWHSLIDAMEKAQDRGKEQREKALERQKKKRDARRNKKLAKIAERAEMPELVGRIEALRKATERQEEITGQLVTLEPENLTDEYVGQEREGYMGVLGNLRDWRNATIGGQEAATARIAGFLEQIARIEAMAPQADVTGSKKGQGLAGAQALSAKTSYDKEKWKIPELRKAVETTTTLRDETLLGELEELSPLALTGILSDIPSTPVAGVFGGRIFDTQNTIRELGLKPGSSPDNSESAEYWKEQARLANLRNRVFERQKPIIDAYESKLGFAGMFAKGGSIPAGMWGIAGERGPEPVIGPATVVSNSDAHSGAFGSPSVLVQVVDGQPSKTKVYVDDKQVEAVVERVSKRQGARARLIGSSRAGRGMA